VVITREGAAPSSSAAEPAATQAVTALAPPASVLPPKKAPDWENPFAAPAEVAAGAKPQP
jgi:hypothetical protein